MSQYKYIDSMKSNLIVFPFLNFSAINSGLKYSTANLFQMNNGVEKLRRMCLS